MFKSMADSFNSNLSYNFIQLFDNYRKDVAEESYDTIPQPTFAPSSMQCPRLSWFRLRQSKPDDGFIFDITKDFSATVGTLIHRYVQDCLYNIYKENWVDIDTYVIKNNLQDYEVTKDDNSLEYFVHVPQYKLRFACDGIINIENKPTLFELKSVSPNIFSSINEPLEKHMEQIKTYCAFLNLDMCMLMYIDRLYGNIKAYSIYVSIVEKEEIKISMQKIINQAQSGLCPDRLPNNSDLCKYCKYKKLCKQYG